MELVESSRPDDVTVEKPWATCSRLSLACGALFFAASLTPSLLPRHYAVQGLLSGLALAVGYGVGFVAHLAWRFLELRLTSEPLEQVVGRLAVIASLLIAGGCLQWTAFWQNSIRRLMQMTPVSTAYPWRVAVIACLTAIVLIAASRGLRKCWLALARKINRVVPRHISHVLSALVVVALLILTATHVLGPFALNGAEQAFLELDELVDADVAQPSDRVACGAAGSLVGWKTIGRRGKHFLVRGPTQEQIARFWNQPARQPLRVYVGFRSARTARERARLALGELIRIEGFKRSLLVIATPTGTGWLDPGAVDTLEYLHKGDTAIVSTQYSYLPGCITFLVDPNRSRDAAVALFKAVYAHWTTLPKETRPKLYLHGWSLGALGSESSVDLFTVLDDPIQGGVWSGPLFPSTVWGQITENRDPGSPAWLPKFGNGSTVRFMGRENLSEQSAPRWGPMRFVYIQHASDPMSFFSPQLLYRNPAWLEGPRGPDVSPSLRWFPIVTFLQAAFDIPMATTVPAGYGHNFDAASYIEAWTEVTQPSHCSAEQTARLKHLFAKRRSKSTDGSHEWLHPVADMREP